MLKMKIEENTEDKSFIKNRNKIEGITLIALVVTIVVLLILAFVTIQILMKDGIVDKSKEAKEETIMAQEREYIKLAYQNLEMERMNNGEDITTDRVGNELKKYDEKTKTKGIQESEIGEKEIVIKKENGVGYAEIEYTETGHKYVVSLIMKTNISYSITYNLNGGTATGNPVQYSPSETIKLNNPTQSWHKFIGWTGSNGTIPEMVVTIPKGSTGNKEYTANWIELEAVCKVGETKYESIQAAIEACSKTAGDAQTTITVIKNTEEEFKTYEGQNIILNLNGYTIKNISTDTPLCTNNGTLTIINGQLKSENGTTILNKGTVTIGDNSTSINANVPTIYGKQIGIKNEGVLNFYDGKVQGIIPIQGNVNDTPAEYGPVTTDYSNGITTLQLGIVNNYEARIGWVYYTKLQEAIDVAKSKETVTIIKDIQLQDEATVSDNKDMILDLNGYTLTIVPEKDRVIQNNGNLEIIDSNIAKSGNITITSTQIGTSHKHIYSSGIRNENQGKLVISDVMIDSYSDKSYNYACGIYNTSINSVEILKGTINSNMYGVYNDEGKIDIKGGTIISTRYGVYNNNTGTVNINGGTISGVYGVYNNSTGDITFTEGIINSNTYGIYNKKEGNVDIEGGKINSLVTGGSCNYGIFNDIGKVVMKNGSLNITSTGGYKTYGIYNANGMVEILGGEINSNELGSANECGGIYNSGTIEIKGGKITGNSKGFRSYGINNSGVITIYNGEIYCTLNSNISTSSRRESYGIYNSNTITILGGTVTSISAKSGSSYGIYNIGKVTIGNKENTVSLEEPVVLGLYTGMYQSLYKGIGLNNSTNSEAEFYNGIIKGISKALLGNITKIRENTKIENNTIEDNDSIYLVENINKEYIVQIEENRYYTLQEAIDSIEENEEKTIQLIRNFELEEKIEFNKNIILDLNGYTITNKYYKIENIGKLQIVDSTGTGEGKIECIDTITGIINNKSGNLILKEGKIECNSINISYGIYNNSIEKLEILGGNISSNSSGNNNASYGIYNNNTGTVKIVNGSIGNNNTTSEANYSIYNKTTGTIEIVGGIINSSSSQTNYGIYNSGTGRIKIIETMINITSVYSSCYGIYNTIGTIEIIGGNISAISNSYYSAIGILNYGEGTIEIKEVNIILTGNGTNKAIYNSNTGIVKITESEIISSGTKNNYGIYNSSTGSIIIGTKEDGIVSEEKPYIKGEYTGTSTSYVGYGIYNNKGKLYYYDGKIEGSTKAVYDIITEIEENTELNYNSDETILTLTTIFEDIAQIGDVTYKSLEDAINSIAESQTTIKILRNINYTNNNKVIIIPNGKNVVLDLNGYTITSTILEKTIQNEGILEIIDTSQEKTGTITTIESSTIINTAGSKLIITGGKIENRTETVIKNEGELVVNGGLINSIDMGIYGIYNDNTGTVKVTEGIVNSSKTTNSNGSYTSYGIYNNSVGKVEIIGGNVNVNSSGQNYGIYNNSTAIIMVAGGTVNSNSNSESYGIFNSNQGEVKVIGGNISSRSESSSSYGIFNEGEGKIVIGENYNAEISRENPIIQATKRISNKVSYGIYNIEGVLLIYDGSIKGNTKAIRGDITEIEEKTELEITIETIEDKEYEVLKLQSKETNVVKVNGVEYDSLPKALEACGEAKSTIEILRDSTPGATIVIEENQNITIDLKGYKISCYIEFKNNGILRIIDTSVENNGKIIGLSEIAILNTGILELNSGSIVDSGYGIKNTGTLNITGGKITGNTYGIYNSTNGKVTVADGEISSNTYGIYNYSTNSVNNINGGYIQSNEYGIYNYNGTTNIASTENSSNTYGIYSAGGTTNIKEGSEIQSDTGIYVSSGTVNIGEAGTMNPESPVITGETYGLSVAATGKVYMYDGQVKGKTGATEGYITYTEEGYTVATKTKGEYTINYLALSGTADSVAEVNGINYSNLQSAINSITGSEEQTIKLTNGIITSETFTISEGQSIILDMNGKTISSDLEVTLINNGNLTIIDTSGKNVAKISSTTGTAIKNTGTLTLGEDDRTENPDLVIIEGKTKGIENTGTVNIYDGTEKTI